MTPLHKDPMLLVAGILSSTIISVQSLTPGKEDDAFSEGIGQAFPSSGITTFQLTQAPNIPPPPPFGSTEYDGPTTLMSDEERHPPSGLEILVAVFFFVAAAWLLVAVFYALLALLVLRMRAQGRLDLDDDNFGRVYLFGTRAYIPLACLLRRYVVTFNVDRQNGSNRHSTYRYISRSERRDAIEHILMGPGKDDNNLKQTQGGVDEELGKGATCQNDHKANQTQNSKQQASLVGEVEESSEEEAVCSICLAEYGDEGVFNSKLCDHVFHKGCILDWLERRSNAECPCCRQVLVSDLDVWEVVKMQRKETTKKKKEEKRPRWSITSRTVERRVRSRTEQTTVERDAAEPGAEIGNTHVHHRYATMMTLPDDFASFTENHDNGIRLSIVGGDDSDESGVLPMESDATSDTNVQNNRPGEEPEGLYTSHDSSEQESCSSDSVVDSDAPYDERHVDWTTRRHHEGGDVEVAEQTQGSTGGSLEPPERSTSDVTV